MAQEFSGFFDSSPGAERSYSAAELATAFRAMGGTGTHSLDDGLRVHAEGGTMRTLVAPGLAMVQGYVYELKDDGGPQMALTHPASAANERLDRIVLRLDLAGAGSIAIDLRTGTPGADPHPPELTRAGTIYEISLARVRIRAGANEITQADVIDERRDEAACGMLVPEALRLDALFERLYKPLATSSVPGMMAPADKAYLDSLKAAIAASSEAVDLKGKYLDNAKFR